MTARAPKRSPEGLPLASGLLLAATLTGVGWLALLPPFEGFDETAHYSYVQELSDTGRWPLPGRSFLSTDVQDYRARFPTAYGGTPPFEQNGGVTYLEFKGASSAGGDPPGPERSRRFVPSEELNWESQHPPLYYLVLSPVYRLTRDWSWPAHILSLRLVSYLLAMGGLALGGLASWRHASSIRRRESGGHELMGAIAMAWPFFVPMFFAEMGRLGNDSLCLMIAGAVWWWLLAKTSKGHRPGDAGVLGLLLGLGLLTKALFVPIVAGVAVFLGLRRQWMTLAIALGVATALGVPWYAHAQATVGVFTGSLEHARLVDQGGLPSIAERFTLPALLRGVAASFTTFIWAGTWSLARVSEGWLLPVVALPTSLFALFAVGLRRDTWSEGSLLSLTLGVCFAVGLLAHVLVRIGLSGAGVGTPGWYAHVLAGPLGWALGLGLGEASGRRWTRWLITALISYVIVFLAAMTWLQLGLYAGCAAKLGDDKHYVFPNGPDCLWDLAGLLQQAGALGYPTLAVPLLLGGLGVGALLVALLLRGLWGDRATPS